MGDRAVALLNRSGQDGAPALGVLDEATSADAVVRLEIHDASRVEWSVSVPLPEDAPLKYAIEVELEIPSNAFARHTPWISSSSSRVSTDRRSPGVARGPDYD